jgi:hypothetical protein
MQWWQFALLGACGGGLVELLSVFKTIATWQADRKTPTGKVRKKPASLRVYLDVPAHAWMTAFRMALGAGAAVLFGTSGQIGGAYAAVALGLSAPTLLTQLGNLPQITTAVAGPSEEGSRNRQRETTTTDQLAVSSQPGAPTLALPATETGEGVHDA